MLYIGGWSRSQYYEWMSDFIDQLLWWGYADITGYNATTVAASSGSRSLGSPIRGQQQRADGSRNIPNNNNNTSSSSVLAVDVGLMLACLTKLVAYDPIVSNIPSGTTSLPYTLLQLTLIYCICYTYYCRRL